MNEEPLDPTGAARLYSVARALTGALTAVDVATAVFQRVAELGAVATALWLVDAGRVRLVGGAGLPEDLPDEVVSMPIESDFPAAEAVRTGRIITVPSAAEWDRRWPGVSGVVTVSRAVAVLPLVSSGRTLGCLHIGYPVEMEEGQFDLAFLARLAELCAAALDRAQLHDAERERQSFLLDAASAVAGAASFSEALRQLASVAVPRLADLCLIDVVDPPGGIRRAAAVHADPSAQPLVDELLERYAPEPGSAHPASQAMAQGRSHWLTHMPEAYLRATTRDERHLEIALRLGFTSFICVPLVTAGETLGAITLVSAGSGRRFGAPDLTLAEDLADRVADVVAAARRYEQERELAHVLQQLLLPRALPGFEGLEISARYLTAHRQAEAGGDFYDVVRLPSGRLGFVIGDVEGHDSVAAALMGQLRSALRVLAGQYREPSLLLDALRWSWDLLGFDRMATCLVGRLDITDGTLVLCSAGHLPPILMSRDGTAGLLPVHAGPPLGAPAEAAVDTRHLLEAGSVLFLYTDGLVEGRGKRLDTELERLCCALAASPPGPLEELLDSVISSRSLGAHRPDDVAMLALRRSGPGS